MSERGFDPGLRFEVPEFRLPVAAEPFGDIVPRVVHQGHHSDRLELPGHPDKVVRRFMRPTLSDGNNLAQAEEEIGLYEDALAGFVEVTKLHVPRHLYIGQLVDGDQSPIYQVNDRVRGDNLNTLSCRSANKPSDERFMTFVDGLLTYHEGVLRDHAPFIYDLAMDQFTVLDDTEERAGEIDFHDLDLTRIEFDAEKFCNQLDEMNKLVVVLHLDLLVTYPEAHARLVRMVESTLAEGRLPDDLARTWAAMAQAWDEFDTSPRAQPRYWPPNYPIGFLHEDFLPPGQ